MIGIMADSHGKPESISKALSLLNGMNCEPIYHLGDVCDSTRPETVEACLEPLRDHGVILIKGNNDHAVVANHFGRQSPPVSREVLKYLKNLPLAKHHRNALFVHSLPFTREMGLASLIGDLGEREKRRFIDEFPNQIMFRGHGHSPEISWSRGRRFVSRSLVAGEKVDLKGKVPCAVTCGALSRGYFMTWSPADNIIECLSFR